MYIYVLSVAGNTVLKWPRYAMQAGWLRWAHEYAAKIPVSMQVSGVAAVAYVRAGHSEASSERVRGRCTSYDFVRTSIIDLIVTYSVTSKLLWHRWHCHSVDEKREHQCEF